MYRLLQCQDLKGPYEEISKFNVHISFIFFCVSYILKPLQGKEVLEKREIIFPSSLRMWGKVMMKQRVLPSEISQTRQISLSARSSLEHFHIVKPELIQF